MLNDFFYTEEPFIAFGALHLWSVIIFGALGALFIYYGSRLPAEQKEQPLFVLAVTETLVIIIWVIIEIALGRFYIENDLPLIFCNLMALLMVVYWKFRNQTTFNILYFVIIVGAMQSVITPSLKQNIPHYEYWKFWMVHIGLITFILYEIIVLGKRPTFKGILQTFGWIQTYVVFIILVNFILGSNYLFLNVKPTHATILDFFGPWPFYIIVMDLVLIPYFFITYLPFLIADKLRKNKRP